MLNLIWVSSFSQNPVLVTSDDFQGVIFSRIYEIPYSNEIPLENRFTPSKREIMELEKSLKDQLKFINRNQPNQGRHYGPIIHKNLRKYIRQYVGIINENGQRIIHVNFVWNGYSGTDDSWKSSFVIVMDGGSHFWNINYRIEEKEFFDFSVNGVA
ncbi:hypothetical protein DMZ48_08430 [Robertkochia solimangrovi]|nr:hypothetical protein DMZ48_08430 [Robertkochia solimangrovi]